jgi:HAD superfamily hydrolase (TIGR01549 family)
VPTPPKALLLDLDGTLLDGGYLDEAAIKTCDYIVAAHPGLDRDTVLAANAATFANYWPEIEDEWTLGRLTGAEVSLEVWRRTLRVCHVDDRALAESADEAFREYARAGHCLYPDAQEFLAAVHGRFPLAVITNGATDSQPEKLRCTGIESIFDAVIISGEQGIAKPDPRIFQLALDTLGVEPTEAWHIGDNLAADVAGAHAACVTAVWLNRTGRARRPEEAEPDVEIASLTELIEQLGLTEGLREP